MANALAYGHVMLRSKCEAGYSRMSLKYSFPIRVIRYPKSRLSICSSRFFRGTNQSGQGGLGLGLYIAAEIAKVYGGTLTVASSSGRNTLQVSDAPSSYDPAR